MRELVHERQGTEEPCPYLPGERATMRFRSVESCSPETYQSMLERGWRRFGRTFFRPTCRRCEACRSLRVPVAEFHASRAMRRTLRANTDVEVTLEPPQADAEHLGLYHRYHAHQARSKGWRSRRISGLEYAMTFVVGAGSFGRELQLRLGGRLIGVALVDLLPGALSAVYCYYDPELRSRSLGVLAILREIELARTMGALHLYLGYWIDANLSMRYKARYRPHQILDGRPEGHEAPRWSEP